jgi:anaerobic C4-dicarboxylate transporter
MSLERYLTYSVVHVVPPAQVTVGLLPAVVGVQLPAVSRQYHVPALPPTIPDPPSVAVSVTGKFVFLHTLFALSVVTGAVASCVEDT